MVGKIESRHVSRTSPLVGLSLMPTEDFRDFAWNLVDREMVDVIEWSFDMIWEDGEMTPSWCESLLDDFSARGRLLGHGVTFSPFSGGFSEHQKWWLEQLRVECDRRRYIQISEHFGFMEAGAFVESAPMPVPMTEGAISLGRRCLEALTLSSGRPVGLENLALAFCVEDVRWQGKFLEEVLSRVDGFLVLDLHNLYCQSVNFDVPMSELLGSYPLERVRELHISGGSWSARRSGTGPSIRRDTHDGPVPERVFEILPEALDRCPGLEYVIFERLGGTIDETGGTEELIRDYERILETVDG